MVQINRSLTARCAALAAATLLCACSTPAAYRPPPAHPAAYPGAYPGAAPSGAESPDARAPGEAVPRPAPPMRSNQLSPATRALVTQAHAQIAHADLPGASSTLDRALRIEPDNPLLWVERGRLRLTESDPHQAEICGRKALALASGDRSAQALAGRLLADALRAQGRNQAAHEIESQPYMR